jgi:hypothetical protein
MCAFISKIESTKGANLDTLGVPIAGVFSVAQVTDEGLVRHCGVEPYRLGVTSLLA